MTDMTDSTNERKNSMNNKDTLPTVCAMCADHDIDTPAARRVDAAQAIMDGFGWDEADAISAGYSHDEPLCEACILQLPMPPTASR